MASGLAGKTFAIAGGSKGIGRELVEQLAAEGAKVHVYARTCEVSINSPDVDFQACDFADPNVRGSGIARPSGWRGFIAPGQSI